MKNRKKNTSGIGGGSPPKPPRFIAFAPGFLDREASCARAPGIPAPESALGLRLRRALPSAQVRPVYQDEELETVCPFTQKTCRAHSNRKRRPISISIIWRRRCGLPPPCHPSLPTGH